MFQEVYVFTELKIGMRCLEQHHSRPLLSIYSICSILVVADLANIEGSIYIYIFLYWKSFFITQHAQQYRLQQQLGQSLEHDSWPYGLRNIT
jgi:hypothetical protein